MRSARLCGVGRCALGRSGWRLRITLAAEGFQPSDDIRGGELAALEAGGRGRPRDGGLLHAQVDLDVAMRGGELGVAEPSTMEMFSHRARTIARSRAE